MKISKFDLFFKGGLIVLIANITVDNEIGSPEWWAVIVAMNILLNYYGDS